MINAQADRDSAGYILEYFKISSIPNCSALTASYANIYFTACNFSVQHLCIYQTDKALEHSHKILHFQLLPFILKDRLGFLLRISDDDV